MRLEGKTALVTGAGSGIGKCIAETYAREGARVALADINVDAAKAAARAIGNNAIAMRCDVTKKADFAAAVAETLAAFGGLDILVNNAGIETIVPLVEMTDQQWERVTNVNLRGPWLCSQVFCRRVISDGRKGNIVNIGSIQSAKILPGRTHYAPSKLAIEALTRNTSAEMMPLGIRVNCVHPGFIATHMTEWILKDPNILSSIVAQISAGRPGEPRDIGNVVAFFASDQSSYVTGQSIHVEGGWILK